MNKTFKILKNMAKKAQLKILSKNLSCILNSKKYLPDATPFSERCDYFFDGFLGAKIEKSEHNLEYSKIAKAQLCRKQFLIFNPWKVLWNWIAFSQNSFVMPPGLSHHLIRRDTGRLENMVFTSNPIVSAV